MVENPLTNAPKTGEKGNDKFSGDFDDVCVDDDDVIVTEEVMVNMQDKIDCHF